MAKLALRKNVRIAIPIAVAVLFLLGGWTLRNKLAADRQGEWVRATRGDLVAGFDVTGTLASVSSEALGPPQLPDVWSFKISMLAPEGSEIKKGQPVVRFDTSDLQRRLDEKTAEADQARKEIEKERGDLALSTKGERMKLAETEARLRKTELKLDKPAEIDTINERRKAEIDHSIAKREATAIRERLATLERAASARIALLESRRSNAEAIVARTRDSIRGMTLLSPRDGTVIYVTNGRGDKKKVGENAWRGERIVEIPDLTKMKAEGEVDEVDAGRVTIGQRVTLRLDAHPDDEINGTITRAGRTVQAKRGTFDPVKVLRVEIALDRTDPAKMRPGMRFQGTVELGRIRNAVLIPRAAVHVSARGPFLYRRGALSVETVPLRLGRENEKFVEVVAGVEPRDRVLVPKQGEEEGS